MFSFTTLKSSKLWQERRTLFWWILIFVIYFGITIVIFWIFGLGPLYRVMRSHSWFVCPAVVIECGKTWEHHGKNSGYILHMRYEYLWQNQKMEGDRYDFFLSRHSSVNKSVDQIVASFPPGKKIECLVNPENPSEAVVTRSIPWVAWGGILLPLLIMLGEIFVALLIIFAILKEEQPSSKMIQETKNHP